MNNRLKNQKGQTDAGLVAIILVGGSVIALVLALLLVGGIMVSDKIDSTLYPHRADQEIALMHEQNVQWVAADKEDTSYVHICGKAPCKFLQK